MPGFGKILIILGAFLIIAGLLFVLGAKIGLLGQLPGDFVIKNKNFTFMFPLASSVLISIFLTAVFYLVRYLKK